jgi:hypothetical protein
MIIVDDVLVSDDLIEKSFVCNLKKCKGACCEEGDYGAPLNLEEIEFYQIHLEKIKPFMAPAGLEVLEKDGFWEDDLDGEPVTTTVRGRDCVFVKRDEDGTLKCSIENAYHAGALEYNKPISCHLYPIRITKTKMGDALNYDRWDICSDACSLGEALKIPVYQFLKEPLIRKYGSDWYEALDQGVRE